MGSLNANVTLGSGVVPVPGQINVPPGADEPAFDDAFAEAQAVRLNARAQQALQAGDRPDVGIYLRDPAPVATVPTWRPSAARSNGGIDPAGRSASRWATRKTKPRDTAADAGDASPSGGSAVGPAAGIITPSSATEAPVLGGPSGSAVTSTRAAQPDKDSSSERSATAGAAGSSQAAGDGTAEGSSGAAVTAGPVDVAAAPSAVAGGSTPTLPTDANLAVPSAALADQAVPAPTVQAAPPAPVVPTTAVPLMSEPQSSSTLGSGAPGWEAAATAPTTPSTADAAAGTPTSDAGVDAHVLLGVAAAGGSTASSGAATRDAGASTFAGAEAVASVFASTDSTSPTAAGVAPPQSQIGGASSPATFNPGPVESDSARSDGPVASPGASAAAALDTAQAATPVSPVASPTAAAPNETAKSDVVGWTAGQVVALDAYRSTQRVLGRGGQMAPALRAAPDNGNAPAVAAAAGTDRVAGTQSSVSGGSATDQRSDSAPAGTAGNAADPAASTTAATSTDAGTVFATSAASAVASLAVASHVRAGSEAVAAAAGPSSVEESANRIMNQVVQTIRTFQTAAGPSVEARVSDPDLGDVRVIVTGRAGEVVQAQLVCRDRATADALIQATARVHATSDALAGVSVSVRSEGGSTSGERSGRNPFEAAGWTGGGYGPASDQAGREGRGQAFPGDPASAGFGTGAGTNSNSAGTGAGSGSADQSRPAIGTSPAVRPRISVPPDLPIVRPPVAGSSSLDIRA